MSNLIRRLAARYILFLTINMLLLAGFEFLLCAIVSSMDIPGILTEVMKNIPSIMRTFIEQQFFGGLTSAGLLAFGWGHPIALAIGTAAAIVLATQAVAGEIENGSIELVMSEPLSRNGYFAGNVLFGLLSLALLSVIGAFGTFLGQHIYGIRLFSPSKLLLLTLNYFLLHGVWYALTLLLSVFGREAGRVGFVGFLLALVSYLLHVISQLWPQASYLAPYTVHNYYSAQMILIEGILPVKSVLVLVMLAAICIFAAGWRFKKRDLP